MLGDMLVRPFTMFVLAVASFFLAAKAVKALAPSLHGFVRGLLTLVAGVGLLVLADAAYFEPRCGGYAGCLTDGWMAGSATESLAGNLGAVQSALSIYYGDHDGKCPETLDELWKDKRYLERPLGHADVYAEVPGRGIARAHWYRDTAKVKVFASVKDADDSGGWGYVSDPRSPDYCAFFVNCTHENIRKGVPWNTIGQRPAAAPSEAPPAAVVPSVAAPAASPAPVPSSGRSGLRGWVMAGTAKVAGAEIVFVSEDGARNYHAVSGPGGRYEQELPPGRYRVTATAAGRAPYSTGPGFDVVLPQKMGTANIFFR